MVTGTRRVGEFCWVNMLTPRAADARAFFGELLRWTYVELPGLGHRIQVGGRDVGGLFDVTAPNTPPGTPPQIGVMVKVESADKTARRVAELGGKARPAFDIGDAGRLAVCFDPNGVEFDAWQPRTMLGTDVDSREHGAPTWFETLTSDVDRAAEFYGKLFGWTSARVPNPEMDYRVFALAGEHVGGAMPLAQTQLVRTMPNVRPHWTTYFAVEDADAIARDTARLRGTICVPVQDIPNIGRFCGVTSPQGVTFFVLQYVSA